MAWVNSFYCLFTGHFKFYRGNTAMVIDPSSLVRIAFFIGNLFPLALNVLIWKTIKLQATQSATGLLYVSVVSILFSDLILKYYLLEYGFIV